MKVGIVVSSFHSLQWKKRSIFPLPLPTFWFFLPNGCHNPGQGSVPWKTPEARQPALLQSLEWNSSAWFLPLLLIPQKEVLNQVSTSSKISSCQPPLPAPAYFSLEDLTEKTGQTRQASGVRGHLVPMLHHFPSIMPPLAACPLPPWAGRTTSMSLII